MVRRRRILKTTGAAVIGSGVLATSTSAASGERGWKGVRKEAPSNVEIQKVSYGNSEQEEDIDTGVWIEHSFGYYIPGDSREEAWENLSKVDFTVRLEGDDLENPKEYIAELNESPDGPQDYLAVWDIYTPPRAPGVYTLFISADAPDNYAQVEGTYEITPGR